MSIELVRTNHVVGSACFVTIFRLAIVVNLDLSDLTWNTVDQIIWTTLELFW